MASSSNTALKWLNAWFRERKASATGYTLSRLALDLGTRSSGHAKMVLEGKRRLTLTQIHRLARRMDLAPREHEIWEATALLDQSGSKEEAQFYRRRLRALGKRADRKVGASAADLESEDLKALVSLHGKPVDHSGRHSKRIARLMSAGLLEERDGTFRMVATQVEFADPTSRKPSIRVIQERSLLESLHAFRVRYEKGAKFYAQSVTLTDGQSERVRREIERLLEASAEISDEAESGPHGPLHSLNIQFFRCDPESE